MNAESKAEFYFLEVDATQLNQMGQNDPHTLSESPEPFQSKRRLESPHVVSAVLNGALKDCYKIKLRQSGYRLVYQVNDNKLIVTVIAVGKRNKNHVYDEAEFRKI
ncbi:type II toxin-antitoxin system RelE/ParE family toxin [Legionella dresdenensis]|uniref:Type II toxin-antitoxin system RelE/ParE family toxin n=1 Tax=Legionella dresdenensis TaxID=450200 RepID=A0ABV8CG44_9GAMM